MVNRFEKGKVSQQAKHASYANVYALSIFCNLSERISGMEAATEAQQSATESSSSVLLQSTTKSSSCYV